MKDVTICLFLVLSFCASCLYSKGSSQNSDSEGVKSLVQQKEEQSNGQIRDLKGFSKIEVSSIVELIIRQSDTYQVKVLTDDKLLPYVVTRCNGTTLEISTKDDVSLNNEKIEVYVSLPSLEKLKVSGAANVHSEGILSGNELELKLDGAGNVKLTYKGQQLVSQVDGAGDVELEFYGQQLDYNLSGAGKAKVFGETKNLKLVLSGAGDFKSDNLKVTDASVQISGAGSGKINVANNVEGSVSGAGNLYLKGNPKQVNVSKSGAGEVKRD